MDSELDALQQLPAAEDEHTPCGIDTCFMITAGPWK